MTAFPFGKTDIKRETVADQIDQSRAIHELEKGDVSEPRRQLDSFLSGLPELLNWLDAHGRDFPWRYTADPWRVYISEILLQRTRGSAVEAIYEEFFARYPAPSSLASTSETELRSIIDSLGFGNQRTRTLQEVAEMLVTHHNGKVPESINELKQPWRVGDYSARATLLFAFGNPEPLVDANIARIIARYFDYNMPRQPHKNSDVYALMKSLTPSDPEIARAFYFALLDHGALLCVSEEPHCSDCPINDSCRYRLSKSNQADGSKG